MILKQPLGNVLTGAVLLAGVWTGIGLRADDEKEPSKDRQAAPFRDAPLPARADFVLQGVSKPFTISLGDLNNDGKTDLAVSSRVQKPDKTYDDSKSRVYLFFQKNGQFSQPADRALEVASPWGMAIGDFDGDDKNDLAVAQTERHLHLFLGGEDFGVDHRNTNVNHGSRIRDVVAGRLSEDGKMDFLCGPVWRKWHGGDRFRAGYFNGPKINDNGRPILADLDQDDQTDVIFPAVGNQDLRLYYGPFSNQLVRTGDLADFVALKPPSGTGASIAVGDMNDDGRPDIVVSATESVLIYEQDAPAGFKEDAEPSRLIKGAAGSVRIADFNRDGLDDLLVLNNRKRKLYLFLQKKRPAPGRRSRQGRPDDRGKLLLLGDERHQRGQVSRSGAQRWRRHNPVLY